MKKTVRISVAVLLGSLIFLNPNLWATPDEDYAAAMKLLDKQKIEEGINLLRKISNDEAVPRSLRSKALESIGYHSIRRGPVGYDAGVEAYLKAVELAQKDEDKLRLQLLLCTVYAIANKPESAWVIYESVARQTSVSNGYYATEAELGLGTLDLRKGNIDAAIARYREVLKRPDLGDGLFPAYTSFLMGCAGSKTGVDNISKLIAETVAARPKWPVDRHVYMMYLGAVAHMASDPAGAEALYLDALKLVESDPKAVGLASDGYRGLARVQTIMGQKKKALASLSGYLEKYGTPSVLPYVVDQLLENDPSQDYQEKFCAELRKNIGADLLQGNLADAELRQQALVKVLLNMGSKDALPEARVLFYVCSSANVQTSIDLLVKGFRSTDLTLARANGFLKFQRFGPAGEDQKLGTEDDLEDMLNSISPLNAADDASVYKQALDKQPSSYKGYQTRATIYLYLEKPLEAFRMLQKSFQSCPVEEAELQAATDALTGMIIRVTKDVAGAEKLVQYLMFGTAGKDGKTGSSDDIENPLPEIEKRLVRAQGQPSTAGMARP